MSPLMLMLLFLVVLMDTTNAATEKKIQKATRSVVITAEEEKGRDPHGYQAIAEIHREMDDDHSGSIDRSESTGFMAEDMNMRGSDARRREKAFHGEDDAITIDDLWEAWFESEERTWSNEEVLHWMVSVVNLPQYAGVISSLNIDGRYLPRLAVHNSTFMTNTLGIKSSVHRQKLRLNALDVVLFGYRDPSSRGKDIALGLLLLLLTSLIIVFVRQRRRARSQLSELRERLNQLKTMENEFEDVQKKFEDECSKRNAEGTNQSEMEMLREQLDEAHKRLGNMEVSGSATPLALQPLLRKTCENELAVVEKEKQACIEDMKAAMEVINSVAKRQGSLLNSLKLATGANTGADKVDSQIYTIKQRMERVHSNTRELQERWMQIESLCGFPILYHNEGASGRVVNGNSTQFYRGSGSSSASSKSLTSSVIKPVVAVVARPTLVPKVSSTVAPSTLAAPSSMTPRANGRPVFYAQTPERIERIEENIYNSMQSLSVGDSVSAVGSPPVILLKEKEKKKKLFGLFKKNSSRSLPIASNGN